MTQRNLRGSYYVPTHDYKEDWDWLAKWQPNVIRLMLEGKPENPNSFDVHQIKRVHDTCPDATLLLRCWDVDDRNFAAHDAMVADPRAEAERQVDWWSKVIDNAQAIGVPRAQLMAGMNNETGPDKDGSLYPYTEHALTIATPKEIRLGVLVFSVGRPSLPGEAEWTIDSFAKLDNLIIANNGARLLHQYMQPEGMYAVWTDEEGKERKDWTYLMGRDLRWPMNPKVDVIIAEWGLNGLLYNRYPDPKYGDSGWTNFKEWPPSRYADEYVECVKQASPNVIAICPYLQDWKDHKWQSFDLRSAYGEFLARKDLCVKEIAAPTTPDTPPFTTHLPDISSGATETPMWVNVTAGGNLRTWPVTGDVLIAVPYGEQITVQSPIFEDGWLRVRYQNTTGYMRSDLLSATKPDAPTAIAPAPTQPAPEPVQPSDNFERALAFVKKWEGGWADNPADPGGATNKGITLGTYTRWRQVHGQPAPSKDDLRNLSDAETNQIYYDWYWLESGADQLPWPLCLAQMDTAVNAGTGRAKEMLERSNHNFLAYVADLIGYYAIINGFATFGRGWMLRRADLLREASK